MNVIDRIKDAIEKLQDIDFARTEEQRLKTLIGVNSPNPIKARATLSSPEFAQSITASVVPIRKTISTGFMVRVDDPEYGKPIFIRIRRGGILASAGIKSEFDLVAKINGAIESGYTNLTFKDKVGGNIVIEGAVSVRQTGNDPGSRSGNRGDIEIMDQNEKAHRISLKKTNASGVAGIARFLKDRRLRIQKSLGAFIAANQPVIHPKGYVSVQIRNPKMFSFCWFGNDIDENGGVVIGDFDGSEDFTYDEANKAVFIECERVFSPKDDIKKLIEGERTSVYLLMQIDKRLHMEIMGSYNGFMAKRYELPGFEIEGITDNDDASASEIISEDGEDELIGEIPDSSKVTLTLKQLRQLIADLT